MRSPLNFMGITQKKSLNHKGIDLGWNSKYGGKNAPVFAPDDGYIVVREYQATGGYVLGLYHPQYNVTSEFGHLKKGSLLVKVGDKIKKGQQLANMGNTGSENGKKLPFHLHYGIYKGKGLKYGLFSAWLDPTKYLNLYDGQKEAESTLVKLNHTKKVTAKNGLNIRDKASVKGKIVRTAKYNEQVECYGNKKGWELVDNFKKYYCSANYLK